MSASLKPMTLDAFLAWEERQEIKYEFDGVRPIAMVGGTAAHAILQRNLAASLTSRLRGSPCAFFGSDMKIEIHGKIRYSDGFVICSPVHPRATRVTTPVVVFEVLSRRTMGTDMIVKNQEYPSLPSVRRYVMLAQDRIAASVYAREGEDWLGRPRKDGDILAMPEIGIELPFAELYEGIDFSALADDEDDDDGSSLR
jgi:Uma2 family endonuclease